VTDDLEATIGEVREATEPPGEDNVAFDAPWQARAFALIVTLRRREDFPWEAFQTRLVEELEASGRASGAATGGEDATDATGGEDAEDAEGIEAAYYGAWLSAFERLLLEEGVLDDQELAERVAAFASGERDASEFVVGDHGHSHDHGERHAHTHDNDDDRHSHDR